MMAEGGSPLPTAAWKPRRFSKAALADAVSQALWAAKGAEAWDELGDLAHVTGETLRQVANQQRELKLGAFLRLTAAFGAGFAMPVTALVGCRLAPLGGPVGTEDARVAALLRLAGAIAEGRPVDSATAAAALDVCERELTRASVRQVAA